MEEGEGINQKHISITYMMMARGRREQGLRGMGIYVIVSMIKIMFIK